MHRYRRGRWGSLSLLAFAALSWPLPARAHDLLLLPTGQVNSSREPKPAYAHQYFLLQDLTGAALEAHAIEITSTLAPDALDALIYRAGTTVPPGLPEAVQSQREAARATALDWLKRDLGAASEERRQAWLDRLVALLEEPDRGPTWAAAARVSAALGRFELAPRIARLLDLEAGKWRAEVARAALFEMYRRWFPTTADFERFYELAQGHTRGELFLDDLAREQQEATDLRLRLIDLQPQREAVAALSLYDSTLRVRGARALRRGVGEGRVSAEEAIDALVAHLEKERHPQALRATADALLQLIGVLPYDSPYVARLRRVMLNLAENGERALQWPVLEALARLPWAKETSTGEASLAQGQVEVSELLEKLVREHEVLDSDMLVQAIELWRSLLVRKTDTGPRSSAAFVPAREALDYLMVYAEVSPNVRLAAASSLALLLPSDPQEATSELMDLLGRVNGSAELEVELLRSFPVALLDDDATQTSSLRLRRFLFDHLGDPNTSLRVRSIELVGALGERSSWDADVLDALVARLPEELLGDVQWTLLQTLTRTHRSELLDRMLGTRAVEDLLVRDPRRAQETARALRQLVASDTARSVALAEHLCAIDETNGRRGRLEQALAAVLGQPADAVRTLAPEQHERVLAWALEWRDRSGGLPVEGESLLTQLDRLLHVHAAALEDGASAKLALTKALLLGDRAFASDPPGEPEPVLALYGQALAASEQLDGDGGDERFRILRERARFLDRAGRTSEALADYDLLLERFAPDSDCSRPEVLIELVDLRRIAALLVDRATRNAAGDQAARDLSRACTIGLALVHQASWPQLPPQVRLDDLRDLADRTLRAGSAEHTKELLTLFDDLPALPTSASIEDPGKPQAQPAPDEPTLWRGLLRERAWHESLLALKLRLSSPPASNPHGGTPKAPAPAPASQAPRSSSLTRPFRIP